MRPGATRSRLLRGRVLIPLTLVVVLLGAVGWLAVRGMLVKAELEALVPLAETARAALKEKDPDRLDAIAADAAGHAERARDLTSDPLWRGVEALPVLGPNAAAVRIASGAVAGAADGIRPVFGVLREPDAATDGPGDALIDLDRIARLREPLSRASSRFADAREELRSIDTGALADPLSEGVDGLAHLVEAAADVLRGSAEAAALAPGLLGHDEPRNILVLVQNPAELRTGGGITGTFVLLRADAGRVTMREHIDSSVFRSTKQPVLPVPASTTELYGDALGRFVQNTSMTTDFPLTAALAREWWSRHSKETADVIVSIDPLVLRAVLAVRPPVELPDGSELTSGALVDTVLVQPYLRLTGPQQSVYQAGVTAAIFERILDGGMDVFSLMSALATPVAEGRISMWSAREEEQDVLDDGPLAGPRARQLHAGADAFSVHLNDVTSGKMGTYLRMATAVSDLICRSDGRHEVAVTVDLRSVAPADAARMPASMTGRFNPGRAGDILTDVSVVAPEGWFFGGVTDGSARVTAADVVDEGMPTTKARVVLAPGEERGLVFRFIAPDAGRVAPVLLHTPMVHPVEAAAPIAACD